LPSSEIRWLRRGAIGVSLLLAFLALIALPARHALLEIWPGRVQELVLSDGEVIYGSPPPGLAEPLIVARTFPETLLALEFRDGRLDHGFLVHKDHEAATWWVQLADGLQVVDADALRRQFAPNAMSPGERVELMHQRLVERRSVAPVPVGETLAGETADSAEGDDL